MPVSTAGAAKAALKNIIDAATTATVAYGSPVEDAHLDDSLIYLGRTTRTSEFAQIGRAPTRRREEYTIAVALMLRTYGKDPAGEQACEEAAWALVSVIEDAVRADATLGGVLNEWADISEQQEMNTSPLTDGWFAKWTGGVTCRARI
jgi:hypothetical protein